MNDEIMREVWKAKEALAAKCNHDVKLLVEHLRRQERSSSAKVVDLHAQQHDHRRASR
jgi:hypothetical protein